METKYEERGYLTEHFRLFHLKDRPTAEIGWHYHTFHKIIVFLSGHGSYAIEGEKYALRPGDVIFVGCGCVHRPEITDREDYERYILYISPEFLRNAGGETDLETCFQQAREQFSFVARPRGKYGELLRLLTDLESIPKEDGFGRDLLAQAVFLRFLITVTRAVAESRLQYVTAKAYDSKIVAMLQHLSEHLTEPTDLDTLSRQFAMSKYHMMRRFKECTGSTIHSYLSSKRLLLARELLLSGQNAQTACYSCGFQDYSAFSRAYKKLFGTSPRGK